MPLGDEPSDAALLAGARDELEEWRAIWREFRKLQGAGNTPEISNRLRDLLHQGDALVSRE